MERDLESRILPSGLLRGADDGGDGDKFDEGQMTLLRHWVDELGESSLTHVLAMYIFFFARGRLEFEC